uniref:Uncharacterized protein n=1 Tax=Trichobilharzia regenti TaxID=157069 RepID=A0AA85KDP7_TRIRE|nr:unnamed protein product [Trichobilharzia regenti]
MTSNTLFPILIIDPVYEDINSFAKDYDYDLRGVPLSKWKLILANPLAYLKKERLKRLIAQRKERIKAGIEDPTSDEEDLIVPKLPCLPYRLKRSPSPTEEEEAEGGFESSSESSEELDLIDLQALEDQGWIEEYKWRVRTALAQSRKHERRRHYPSVAWAFSAKYGEEPDRNDDDDDDNKHRKTRNRDLTKRERKPPRGIDDKKESSAGKQKNLFSSQSNKTLDSSVGAFLDHDQNLYALQRLAKKRSLKKMSIRLCTPLYQTDTEKESIIKNSNLSRLQSASNRRSGSLTSRYPYANQRGKSSVLEELRRLRETYCETDTDEG